MVQKLDAEKSKKAQKPTFPLPTCGDEIGKREQFPPKWKVGRNGENTNYE